MLVTCMHLHKKGIESYGSYVLEIFYEVILLILSYLLMGFEMLAYEGRAININSWVYIVVCLICLHIGALVLLCVQIRG